MSVHVKQAKKGLSRRTAVLTLLGGGALLLGVSVLRWASVPVRLLIGSGGNASVQGVEGAPLVPSVALLMMAAGLAIGLAGPITRIVAAIAAAGGGVLAVVAAVMFIRDPHTPAVSEAAELTGVRELGGAVTLTPWPWAALVVGAVMTVVALVLPWRMGTWTLAAQRYERAGAPPTESGSDGTATTRVQKMSDWDALSRGEDPSQR